MRRISPNNPVRRRLFPTDDTTEQAKSDNFANILQETIARDREEKMKKWNFDFENETPLEGDMEWFKSDGPNDWVGVEKSIINDDNDEENEGLRLKAKNEVTPKSNVGDESALLARKRRNDNFHSMPNDTGVRRKISFD